LQISDAERIVAGTNPTDVLLNHNPFIRQRLDSGWG
jgi:hypothetical protein